MPQKCSVICLSFTSRTPNGGGCGKPGNGTRAHLCCCRLTKTTPPWHQDENPYGPPVFPAPRCDLNMRLDRPGIYCIGDRRCNKVTAFCFVSAYWALGQCCPLRCGASLLNRNDIDYGKHSNRASASFFSFFRE